MALEKNKEAIKILSDLYEYGISGLISKDEKKAQELRKALKKPDIFEKHLKKQTKAKIFEEFKKNLTSQELIEKAQAARGEQNSEKAAKYYEWAGDLGNSDAQFELAEIYLAEKNTKKGIAYLKEAVQSNHPSAVNRLGVFYEEGVLDEKGKEIIPKNSKLAVECFERAAALGNSYGKFNLATIYDEQGELEKALGLFFQTIDLLDDEEVQSRLLEFARKYRDSESENKEKGVELIAILAKEGNIKAMGFLAYSYQTGSGVKKDLERAIEWYEKAAKLGNSHVKIRLAMLLIDRKPFEAVDILKEIAEKGNPRAVYRLGYFYETGQAPRQSILRRTSSQLKLNKNEKPALVRTKSLPKMTREKNLEEAIVWYKKGAALKNLSSLRGLYRIGSSYETNEPKEAKKLYNFASKHGLARATNKLGEMSEAAGKKEKAFKLYQQASEGSRTAYLNMVRCCQEGIGVQKDPGEALRLLLEKPPIRDVKTMEILSSLLVNYGDEIDSRLKAAEWLNRAAEIYQKNDPEKAKQLLEKAEELEESYKDDLLHL